MAPGWLCLARVPVRGSPGAAGTWHACTSMLHPSLLVSPGDDDACCCMRVPNWCH